MSKRLSPPLDLIMRRLGVGRGVNLGVSLGVGAVWIMTVGIGLAQSLTQGQMADHQRLLEAIAVLNDDINHHTDRLFRLDVEADRLAAAIKEDHSQAMASFLGMQRLSMSPRPTALLNPKRALDTARARSLISSVRPDLALQDQSTMQALDDIQRVQKQRRETFETLSEAEERYDVLRIALEKLSVTGEITGTLSGTAARTYLTQIDQLLGNFESGDSRIIDQTDAAVLVQPRGAAATPQGRDASAPTPQPATQPATQQTTQPTGRPAAQPASELTLQSAMAAERLVKPNDIKTFGSGQDQSTALAWPLPNADIASQFRNDTAPLQFRHGLVLRSGDHPASVTAPFDGQVIFVEELEGYGLTLIQRHGEKVVSILSGITNVLPTVGQWVYQGEQLGTISTNTSSNSADSRLFWQFRRNQRLVDPTKWVR